MLLYDLLNEAKVLPGERKSIDLKMIDFAELSDTKSKYVRSILDIETLILPEELAPYIEKIKKDIRAELEKLEQKSSSQNPQFDLFMNGIIKNCSEAIDIFRKTDRFIYRGMRSSSNAVYGRSFDERRSKDSIVEYSDIFNRMLKEAGVKARRDNSIFCSGSLSHASGYGHAPYIIFPRNGFNCSFSQNTRDLILGSDTVVRMFDKSILAQLFAEIIENPQMQLLFADQGAIWAKNPDIIDKTRIGSTGFFGEYRWKDHQKDIIGLANQGKIDQSYADRVKLENLITPKAVIDNFEIIQDDLEAAIVSEKEIMISGYFYGIRSSFEKEVRKKLGMKNEI